MVLESFGETKYENITKNALGAMHIEGASRIRKFVKQNYDVDLLGLALVFFYI